MTAITVTELSREEAPMTRIAGTERRRAKYYLRFTNPPSGGSTLDMAAAAQDANIAAIEAILSENGTAQETTEKGTFSGTTYTSSATGGSYTTVLLCRLT